MCFVNIKGVFGILKNGGDTHTVLSLTIMGIFENIE